MDNSKSQTHHVVVRTETRVYKHPFATREAAQKWIDKQKDKDRENVTYDVWQSGSVPPV
jgi:hypothetical protein